MTDEDRIPVIVGVGEIVDRPKEIEQGLEPLRLLEEALKRAEANSGAKLLDDIQSLDVVNFLSWRYRDPEQLLVKRLGIAPRHCYYGPVGGESPIRYLHEAAQRIARGECSVAAVCGAEAQSTATKAERTGVTLRTEVRLLGFGAGETGAMPEPPHDPSTAPGRDAPSPPAGPR
jgi:acetyl-CoA C-acetyltransferase